MGWSYGVLSDGREVGYAVPATCEARGCDEKINRGLAYLCGSMHGQDDGLGCGHYFCDEHLLVGTAAGNSMCEPCCDVWEAETGEKGMRRDG